MKKLITGESASFSKQELHFEFYVCNPAFNVMAELVGSSFVSEGRFGCWNFCIQLYFGRRYLF
jgi:hypothetical protein